MSTFANRADICPYCESSFQIVSIKFRLKGATMIATCPNCGLVCPECGSAGTPHRKSGVARVVNALNLRFRYVVALIFRALIVAAVLSHTIHVYGGFSREEVRAGALPAP
jgi:hypothetical protein